MRTAGPAGPGLNPTLWDDEAYRAATTQSKWKYCVAVIREAPDVTVLTEKYLRAVPLFLAGQPSGPLVWIMPGSRGLA
ncbi:hypothetical protein PXH67_39690 (plasmid) [Streptomyces sp. P8-A8]|uniref:hypothetical protein n=1 Tax=Streptomyces sp. P8-A8 TaxID=3029759 RepID=UPI0036DCB5F5